MNNKTVLTLSMLEEFDPGSPSRQGERRFLCPLCGEDKPRDAAHRSLCLNVGSGLWNCKRCKESGRLKEHWSPSAPRAERARAALRRAFEVAPSLDIAPHASATGITEREEEDEEEPWRRVWDGARAVPNTPGHKYLESRGVSLKAASMACVRFSAAWQGRATLVFPLRGVDGSLVAVAGRCVRSGGVDKPGLGPKKDGAFWARTSGFTPLDRRVPVILICEAPLDALSLATVGYPALALCGTSPPRWLAAACAFRRVGLATDADDAGDDAADRLGDLLASFGARCERLRPQGAKDWNQMLQQNGPGELGDWLAPRILL